ncbi:unnamed protein product [Moneuplotes crassus]|uniref:Uncharacterized protein n=1 Tax=Euplotes crassus TaxID=5936 RepID=A0AAD1XGM6_EUPCR|nr:unnamed protein product [Moneuplotes crassus]
MSFSLTDRRKIQLLRRTIQAITTSVETFMLQLYPNKIRFYANTVSTTSTADLTEDFFTTFKALEPQASSSFTQLKLYRNEFLQCFTLHDDKEVEFIIKVNENGESGCMQILKTRDGFQVDTQLLFEVVQLTEKEEEVYEMEYSFEPNMLLVNCPVRKFRNIKGVFKSKSKTEVLKMGFIRDELRLTGEQNSKSSLQISTGGFDNYLNYADLNGEIVRSDNFELQVPLRYIGLPLKISEMMESQFQMAMEKDDENTCCVFIISEDLKGNYCFSIESKNIPFTQVEPSTLKHERKLEKISQKGSSQEEDEEEKDVEMIKKTQKSSKSHASQSPERSNGSDSDVPMDKDSQDSNKSSAGSDTIDAKSAKASKSSKSKGDKKFYDSLKDEDMF